MDITDENNVGIEDDQDQVSAEDLARQLEEEKKRNDKISQDYIEMRKQRDQYESGIKNIGLDLERKGLGNVSMDGNELKIKIDTSPQKTVSEVDQLNEQLQTLETKFKNGDIDDDDYYNKAARLSGEISAITRIDEERKKDRQRLEQEKKQLTHDEWVGKAKGEFPDAWNTSSDLAKKMSELAIDGVDYQNDAIRFYELADRANRSLNPQQKGPNMDAANEFSNLQNSGVNYQGAQEHNDHALTKNDQAELKIKFGEETAKRISRALDNNKKMGSISDNDPYLVNSTIYIPVDL